MNLKAYIKDKMIVIGAYLLLFLLIIFYLSGFHVNISLTISVAILFLLFGLFIFFYEYMRKQSFYRNLIGQLNQLEEKYFIASMVSSPSFLEGKITMQTLYEANKSMHEKINEYQYNMDEFKDYIELWVHEVKMPLASSLLMVHNYPKSVSVKVKEQLDKIDNYVEQVLYYVRSENPEIDYYIKKIDLKTVVNKVIQKNKDFFIYQKVGLNCKFESTDVYSDAKWLEFILNQIVQNAMKYIGTNGTLTIDVKKIENQVILSISDDGIGISPSDLPRIFEKGFTGQNGRKVATSTGMGLYICKKLCDKLGHVIQIESVLDDHTTVTLLFSIDTFYDVIQK